MGEINKAYDPKEVENKWYGKWVGAGYFEGRGEEGKEGYCVMIPPPNVTGVLTMGHVLNNTIQDILVRMARQGGKAALWLPGTDHAGIATQVRVERELKKEEGKTRHEVGREAFLELAKGWRDKHGGIILEQLKRLGASCDWGRKVHTLDEDYSKAVLTAFVKLYERGYIYRGKRMINWCPVSLTALSDEEVVMKTQKGVLYRLKYEVVEEPGEYLEVCTTRPETIMGDTGLAVNPKDERYAKYIGKHVWRPFQREAIPVVGDEAVEMEFGTGVLKVTPAHDMMDFEIGKRHGLVVLDVMNADGTMNGLAGKEFEGMDRFKARKKAGELLKEMGLLVKEEAYENNVGYSERADVPIEPRISEQWFLKYPRVEEAKRVVREGMIKFRPEKWEKTYLNWLDNIQDWCLSRQLWWGHRIPVWYRKGADRGDRANWHVSVEGPEDRENWEQDGDVLDTWASSWLWPFATLGWPDEKAMGERELGYFYPTDDLVTGPDIIFFWVARMIIAGLEFMGDGKGGELTDEELRRRIPFKNVYFTGIVRDKQGRKMSKSLGNSPDPIELIEKYGADGLRFGIISIAPQGQDVHFAEERVEQGKHFCNKLWNACRFRRMSGEGYKGEGSLMGMVKELKGELIDGDDQGILSRLARVQEEYYGYMGEYAFSQAAQLVYNFFWGEFCDWYVEVSKHKLKGDEGVKRNCLLVQDVVLRGVLLMLHAFTPFITEELWEVMGYGAEGEFIGGVRLERGEELMGALRQVGVRIDEGVVRGMEGIRELVTKGRALKAENQMANRKDVVFWVEAGEEAWGWLERNMERVKHMMGASEVRRTIEKKEYPGVVVELGILYVEVARKEVSGEEREKLMKELRRYEELVESGERRLSDGVFLGKAPAGIIEGARKQLAENKGKVEDLRRLLG